MRLVQIEMVMNPFVIAVHLDSELDNRLSSVYDTTNWEPLLASEPGIVSSVYHGVPRCQSVIEFESEEHKNWFLLKYG